jgi:multiple sugar transport system permease protein
MLRGSNGSSTFVIQTVQTAFVQSRFGLASALAIVLLAIVLLVTYIQRRIFKDDEAELV